MYWKNNIFYLPTTSQTIKFKHSQCFLADEEFSKQAPIVIPISAGLILEIIRSDQIKFGKSKSCVQETRVDMDHF